MDDEQDAQKATHPGFTITCDKCGSSGVYIDSDVGFSQMSGAWGTVWLQCDKCDAWVNVWEP